MIWRWGRIGGRGHHFSLPLTTEEQTAREARQEAEKTEQAIIQKSFDNTISKCESCQNALIVQFLPNPDSKKTDPLCVKCKIKSISEGLFDEEYRYNYMCFDNRWSRKILRCSEYQPITNSVLKE